MISNTRSKLIKTSIFILMVLLVIGCTGIRDRQQMLGDTLRAYERNFRWNKFDEARQFYQKPELAQGISQLKGIRISAYEVLRSQLAGDKLKMQQTVKIKYYYLDQMVERSLVDRQTWEYDSSKQAWRRTNKLPEFN